MRALHQLHPAVRLLASARLVVATRPRNLDIIIDLALHAVLIYDECTYSEQIYDSLVRPFYKNNEETINNFSKNIEKYFEKKTQQVQSKVSESAADSTYALK